MAGEPDLTGSTIQLHDPRLDEADEVLEKVASTNRLRSELLPDLGKSVILGDTFERIPAGGGFADAIGATAITTDQPIGIIQTTWELPVAAAEAWLRSRGLATTD